MGNRFIASVAIRIIAGRFGGRRLETMEATGLRPTTDRVRESIFNIVSSRLNLDGVHVLDIFAGTGALGLEALSRGAGTCDFIERDRRTATLIRRNIGNLGLGDDQARVLVGDVMEGLATTYERYDLILADPPYASTSFDSIVRCIAERRLLLPGGLLVLEHRAGMAPPVPGGFRPVLERSFGDTAIALYQGPQIEQA